MVFSSVTFLFLFLPASLVTYYLTPSKYKNLVLLLQSLGFYFWGAPSFMLILIFSSLADYFIGSFVGRQDYSGRTRKIWLTLSLVLNLGLLFYSKYANFFIDELRRILPMMSATEIWPRALVPIGISFYTFKKITYIVDVYKGLSKPAASIKEFLLYVCLYPQLLAGPISKYHQISDQLVRRKHSFDKVFDGIWLFCIGLSQKVIIANSAGSIADEIFSYSGGSLDLTTAWIGAISYTLQIYYDFSGYSHMAIGLGQMFGFDFPENFNLPYISTSITEFWRRWHISLSTFFREYVYIPLGGNRCSKTKTYRNLFIVFLLTGIWHGANWTFWVWGCYHGFFIVLEKALILKKTETWPWYVKQTATFILVMIGWVIFRSETIENASIYLAAMFDFTKVEKPIYIQALNNKNIGVLILGLCLSLSSFGLVGHISTYINKNHGYKALTALVLLIYSLIVLSNSSFHPFIYFQF